VIPWRFFPSCFLSWAPLSFFFAETRRLLRFSCKHYKAQARGSIGIRPMKSFLENFGAVLGIVTISLLLLSVTHEYGYFWIIGSRLQSLLTTGDYFANAILWLPWFAFLAYWYTYQVVAGGTVRYKYFTEVKESHARAVWIFIVVVLPIAGAFVLREAVFWLVASSLSILWLTYGASRLPFVAETDETKLTLHRIMMMIPPIAVLSFAYGLVQGVSDLRSKAEPYTVQMKSGETMNGGLLRTFDKGILFRNIADGRVEFLRWDEMIKLNRDAPEVMQSTLLCHWFGLVCPK
jgi:hypothetical protein